MVEGGFSGVGDRDPKHETRDIVLPESVEVLSATTRPGAAPGNLVLRVPTDAGSRILKVYRRRKGRVRALLNQISHRYFESKRGTSSHDRCETEREALAIWREHGFDTPALLEDAAPPWTRGSPCLWMEDVRGPTLRAVLADPEVSAETKRRHLRRLARHYCRRHRRAIEAERPILAQEHPSAKHVLLSGERLVTFDLEHAYADAYPALDAVVHELATWLRSLVISPGFGEAYSVFVQSYPDRALLDQLRERFFGGGLIAALRRNSDERRRKDSGKVSAMRAIDSALVA